MVTKSNSSFSTSFGTVLPVTLTDNAGTIHSTASDSPNVYKKSVTNVATTDFYLDWDGSEYQQVVDIGSFASAEVPITTKYFWIVDEQEVEKTSYIATLAAANADDQIPTAYAPGEYVPKGTKHFVRITSGEAGSGTYTVYAYAMSGRY